GVFGRRLARGSVFLHGVFGRRACGGVLGGASTETLVTPLSVPGVPLAEPDRSSGRFPGLSAPGFVGVESPLWFFEFVLPGGVVFLASSPWEGAGGGGAKLAGDGGGRTGRRWRSSTCWTSSLTRCCA